jgi:CBS domain containing-hemolysin-like protein
MASASLLAIAVVLLSAVASFFFSLAETSLFSLGKWQVRQLAERNPGRGGLVEKLLTQPQDLLATMALGNTFAMAAMLATALWLALSGRAPIFTIVLGLLVLVLIPCEVVPKTLAVRRPEQWALRVARPLQLLLLPTLPLCRVAQKVNSSILKVFIPANFQPQTSLTDADYQELLDLAFQQGALGQSEKEIILQIISLDRRTAKEVMKPRAQMACISDDLTVEEMIAAAKKFRHRRLPIYDETPDTIVGVLNTRALLLDPQIDLADAIEFPSFVPESMNLLQLLKSLQRQQRGLAIVLDEFGTTAGIVTVEDILEEMIGTIRPETGAEGVLMETLGPGRWRVAGMMRLDDFRREYPALQDFPEAETLGGLLMGLLEIVPKPGDSAVFSGLKLTASVADERRVKELILETVR